MTGADLKRFSEAVLALQDCRAHRDFGAAVLHAMHLLVAAPSHVVNWIGAAKFEDISSHSGDFPREASLEVFNAHWHQHPLSDMVDKTRTGQQMRTLRWSDRTTFRQFRQTALYHDFFRHLRTRHQCAVTIKATDSLVLGLSVNRDCRDFSDRELHLLDLLAPHVRQALGAMIGGLELEDALAVRELASGDRLTVVVDEAGTVLYANEATRRLLRDYFGAAEPDQLADSFLVWLRRHPPAGEHLIGRKPDRHLICVCGETTPRWNASVDAFVPASEGSSRMRCLRLREESEGGELRLAVPTWGLTPREAEILHWMAKGKRNSEIAVILGMSVRTVDKHRENLFVKMGVENRTSAVAMLHRALASPSE